MIDIIETVKLRCGQTPSKAISLPSGVIKSFCNACSPIGDAEKWRKEYLLAVRDNKDADQVVLMKSKLLAMCNSAAKPSEELFPLDKLSDIEIVDPIADLDGNGLIEITLPLSSN